MNKFKSLQPQQIPEIGADRGAVQFGFGGLRDDVPLRSLPLNTASDLSDVEIDPNNALKKSYGWDYVGNYAAQVGRTIAGLAYSVASATEYITAVTISLGFGGITKLGIAYYNGTTWTDKGEGTATNHGFGNLASIVNYAGTLVYTAGGTIQSWLPLAGTPDDLATAPRARSLAIFGDRVVAFYVDGDAQKMAWCRSGIITDWAGTGAGTLYLAETHSDALDPLTGGAALGSSVLAVFRARSIWRGFRTGSTTPAIGCLPWIDGIGCLGHRSILNVGNFIGFLGSDCVPYLLSESGSLVPVGRAIYESLKNLTSAEQRGAASAYNHMTGEWHLLVSGTSYIFDVNRFMATQEILWRKRGVDGGSMIGPGSSYTSTNQVIFAGQSYTVFKIVPLTYGKGGASFTGYWQSRPLNKTNIATLTLLELLYDISPTSIITVKVSGNGGETWAETKVVPLPGVSGKDGHATVSFNTTGSDLRFRIEFDQSYEVRFTGFMATIVERGTFEYE